MTGYGLNVLGRCSAARNESCDIAAFNASVGVTLAIFVSRFQSGILRRAAWTHPLNTQARWGSNI